MPNILPRLLRIVNGVVLFYYGFLKVESPAFPHPLPPAPGRGQRGIWGRRRRLCRLLLPQTPFLRKPCQLTVPSRRGFTCLFRSAAHRLRTAGQFFSPSI